ncbi:hypothetical protein EC973_005072 [Apophysomyces ossiformis]|uniref:Uncharacterized protein n=1 Tax=Apophysomyces ossiformis TaxID=679940 RepID=A0A8H7BPM5_9FUNG|nr:hypothetical protein EC973_005072 [Apophysomyces ossiformis]
MRSLLSLFLTFAFILVGASAEKYRALFHFTLAPAMDTAKLIVVYPGRNKAYDVNLTFNRGNDPVLERESSFGILEIDDFEHLKRGHFHLITDDKTQLKIVLSNRGESRITFLGPSLAGNQTIGASGRITFTEIPY